MSKHSKGPFTVSKMENGYGFEVVTPTGQTLGNIASRGAGVMGQSALAKANANRVADCLNACEGINPAHLPELLSALQQHVEYTSGPGHWFTPYRDEILAAFKKVKP